MALLKPDQFFACTGVRFNSALIRSILASLLATICSAVNCGAPCWVSTADCCGDAAASCAGAAASAAGAGEAPSGAGAVAASWAGGAPCLAAFAPLAEVLAALAGAACFAPLGALVAVGAGDCALFPTPSTPVNTPTTPPIAPPNTPPTGPAALLPSRAPCSTPFTNPCASTDRGAFTRKIAATASATHHLNRPCRPDLGVVMIWSPSSLRIKPTEYWRGSARCLTVTTYRAPLEFVQHGKRRLQSGKACGPKLLRLTAADLRQRPRESF